MPKIFNSRVCYICGGNKTYISPNGYESWYKDYDSQGNFTGRYSCHTCHLEIERERTKKCKKEYLKKSIYCNGKNKACMKEDGHAQLKGSYGYLKEKAKEYGFGDNVRKFVIWGQQNGILNNPTEINRKIHLATARNLGMADYKEYLDSLARRYELENYAEYKKIQNWDQRICGPMLENSNCPDYSGVYIGEGLSLPVLLAIFEYVEPMKLKNRSFDIICKNPRQKFIEKYPIFKFERDNEYKINVKLARLIDGKWTFHIGHNNVPDYFILIGINNGHEKDKIDVLHIWLFKKDENIREIKFWKFVNFKITNKQYYLSKLNMYELKCELESLKNIIKEK